MSSQNKTESSSRLPESKVASQETENDLNHQSPAKKHDLTHRAFAKNDQKISKTKIFVERMLKSDLSLV